MKILINASNLSAGGGLQVADSICRTLDNYPEHKFIVVLSSYLQSTMEDISTKDNIKCYQYNIKNNISTIVFGRDKFLDSLIKNEKINAVLTIFGPSRWNPKKVLHLSGFAMSQLVMSESPFFSIISFKEKVKWFIGNHFRKYLFSRSTRLFYSENAMISQRVQALFKGSKCYTITNTYNQIYDNPKLWQKVDLPKFEGVNILNISTYYPFKNLTISKDIAKYLKEKYRDFKFRFIFTCNREDFGQIDKQIEDCFLFLGKVDISLCPSLYSQADIVFQPTLLECFTAVYPEAMKMHKPIITTDLPFAHGLCGKAAEYYSALDYVMAAEKIYSLAHNPQRQEELINEGEKELGKFDSYNTRSEKLIKIIENNVSF